MKSVRILITDECNASCPNCINRTIRIANKRMPIDKFFELCQYFQKNGVKNVRIMGGEPTTHPDFKVMMRIAQDHFDRVTVFTNAINDTLLDFYPRDMDAINYNFTFSKCFNKKKLMTERKGSRTLELLVSDTVDIEQLEAELLRVFSFVPNNTIVSLTLDCTTNIFSKRKTLIKNFTTFQNFCDTHGIDYMIDHAMPICFVYGTKVPVRKHGAKCSGDCSGLIDTDGRLHFCNQYSNEVFSLYDNGELVPYSLIENHIKLAYYKNQIKVLEKICAECPYYDKFCNGGCFMANDCITREDVIKNTELPIC